MGHAYSDATCCKEAAGADAEEANVIAVVPQVGSSSKAQGLPAESTSYFGREADEFAALAKEWRNRSVRGQQASFVFKTKSVYDGQWMGHMRHGFGVQRWIDGATYSGEWKENNAEGRGRFEDSNGNEYLGEWLFSKAHGQGSYYHKDPISGKTISSYHCQWVNDQQEGYGVAIWADGSTYQGAFSAGQKQGPGVHKWPDGSMYCGFWDNNSMNGAGVYTGFDGRSCNGSWRDSVLHGVGKYSWPIRKRRAGRLRGPHLA